MRAKVLDDIVRAGDESTHARERFRKTAADDVHFVVQSKMVDRPAPLAAKNAESVRIVQHRETTVIFGDLR